MKEKVLIFKTLIIGALYVLLLSKEEKKRVPEPSQKRVQHKTRKKIPAKTIKISRQDMDFYLDNITEVLTQAYAIKYEDENGDLSFKITQIVPGSLYEKIGLKNNDIIYKINGDTISSMFHILGLFGEIKSLKRLSLGIKRRRKRITFNYIFE